MRVHLHDQSLNIENSCSVQSSCLVEACVYPIGITNCNW